MYDLTQTSGRNNVRDLLLLLFFFTLPFFHKYTNVALGLLVLFAIFELVYTRRIQFLRLHWFLPLLFLYFVVSQLLSGGGFQELEKRLLLIAIPLCFALYPNFKSEQTRKKISWTYLLAHVATCIFLFGRAFARSISFEEGQLLFNPKMGGDTESDFFTASIMRGNYFFSEEFSMFMHPTYWCLHLVLALYFCHRLFLTEHKRKFKILLVVCSVVILISIFFLSSKAGILTAVAAVLVGISSVQRQSKWKMAMILGGAVICFCFLLFNPRLNIFLKSVLTTTQINPNAQFGHDLRILSWDASLEVIRDHWIIGVGEANKEKALLSVYEKKGYVVPAQQLLNSHNQYLDLLLGGGIFALSFFLAGIAFFVQTGIREKNTGLLFFLFIFMFNALFENLLSRHGGILFFATFVTFFNYRPNRSAPATQG